MPNPGVRIAGIGGSTTHTIDAHGLRFTGKRPFSNEGTILAVGDSFTYGDEVNDEEAWPAQLQRLTGRRVLNGGVTGYGFDQIVLRAEQLVPLHRPAVVIAGFIENDVVRTEMASMWWRNKPWFTIENDQLELKGVPVPDRAIRLPPRLRHRLNEVLASSPTWLQEAVRYHVRVHRRRHGLAICRKLIERLARLRAEHAVKIVVMAQYGRPVWRSADEARSHRGVAQALFDAAQQNGFAVLDTFPRFAAEPNPEKFYLVSHLGARGNGMIASLLAARLPDLLAGQTVRPEPQEPRA